MRAFAHWAHREALAKLAAKRMVPAITAAAMSTGVMGVFRCFSGTLVTIRLGIFILLRMGVGGIVYGCFLLPLTATSGPRRACGWHHAL